MQGLREVQTVQAVKLEGVRNIAEHGDEVADSECRQHKVARCEHVTACEDSDHEQTTDDAENADDDTDVAVIATILDRKSQQPTVSAVRRRTIACRVYFRFIRDLRMR